MQSKSCSQPIFNLKTRNTTHKLMWIAESTPYKGESPLERLEHKHVKYTLSCFWEKHVRKLETLCKAMSNFKFTCNFHYQEVMLALNKLVHQLGKLCFIICKNLKFLKLSLNRFVLQTLTVTQQHQIRRMSVISFENYVNSCEAKSNGAKFLMTV